MSHRIHDVAWYQIRGIGGVQIVDKQQNKTPYATCIIHFSFIPTIRLEKGNFSRHIGLCLIYSFDIG